MLRVMAHDIVLANTITVTQKQFKEVFVGARLHVAHSERAFFDDIEWLPDVDEGAAPREEIFRFVAEQLCDAHGAGFSSVVAVHEHDGGTLRSVLLVCQFLLSILFAAYRVVKDKHALCANSRFEEIHHLGIKAGAHRIVVIPDGVFGLEIVHRKSTLVECEILRSGPAVGYADLYWCVAWFMYVLSIVALVEVDFGKAINGLGVVDRGADRSWSTYTIGKEGLVDGVCCTLPAVELLNALGHPPLQARVLLQRELLCLVGLPALYISDGTGKKEVRTLTHIGAAIAMSAIVRWSPAIHLFLLRRASRIPALLWNLSDSASMTFWSGSPFISGFTTFSTK
jgi:hypothetical protein